ncbi:MAG TPA: hypothetical protein VGO90_16170 [Chthoniobacteraceae bacterium]|jgi:hypothetical protein|nr:hypothetical protein [Chthoniobacteraceae bacterium]
MKFPTFTASILLSAASLLANDTALNEGSSGPEPIGGIKGPESVIRLVREDLDFGFSRKGTDVWAKFVFRSTKKGEPARQLVGFPDNGAAMAEAGRREAAGESVRAAHESDVARPLENLRTLVNGVAVPSRLQYGWVQLRDGYYSPTKPGPNAALMAWHTTEVTFPPDKDVIIERIYRAPNGANSLGMDLFHYTTATGGAWKGNIGQLVATVTVRDGLTLDDLAWEGSRRTNRMHRESGPFVFPSWAAWEKLSPTQMRLVWDDFEPRTDEGRRGLTLYTISPATAKAAQ